MISFEEAEFAAALNIRMFDALGNTLDTMVKVFQNNRTQNYPDYQELSNQRITLSGGTPAAVLVYKLTEKNATSPHREMMVIALVNKNYMFMNALANDAGWTKYGETLGKIIDSITFSAK